MVADNTWFLCPWQMTLTKRLPVSASFTHFALQKFVAWSVDGIWQEMSWLVANGYGIIWFLRPLVHGNTSQTYQAGDNLLLLVSGNKCQRHLITCDYLILIYGKEEEYIGTTTEVDWAEPQRAWLPISAVAILRQPNVGWDG